MTEEQGRAGRMREPSGESGQMDHCVDEEMESRA